MKRGRQHDFATGAIASIAVALLVASESTASVPPTAPTESKAHGPPETQPANSLTLAPDLASQPKSSACSNSGGASRFDRCRRDTEAE